MLPARRSTPLDYRCLRGIRYGHTMFMMVSMAAAPLSHRASPVRPKITRVCTAHDITGWYWTKAELTDIARRLGVARSGSKAELTVRLVAALSDPASGDVPTSVSTRVRPPMSEQLAPPFELSQQIPVGQPLTRPLREWLNVQAGYPIRVNRQMRQMMRAPDGRTLADLLTAAMSPASEAVIGSQFERNRFWRLIARTNPELTRAQREKAWKEFRSRPTTEREAILEGVP